MKYRTRLSKCYLIQVVDEDGNEVACDYIFCQRKEYAKRRAEYMKKEVEERSHGDDRSHEE